MQETSGVSENSLAITSPYFQELLEISNVEEVATQNDLTVEENLALLRKNAFRTNQVIIRMIQEQVVALEERNVLKQENANLRQDNIELKQKDAVRDQEIKHLKIENAEVKQENVVRDQDIKYLKIENAEVKQENAVKDQDIKHLKRVDVEKDRKIEILNGQIGVLYNQTENLKRENAESRERDIVRVREKQDLEDGIYNPMRQSILNRINAIKQKLFLSSLAGIGKGGKMQLLKFFGKCALIQVSPPIGFATLFSSEGAAMGLTKKAQWELDEIENDVSKHPLLMKDLEFKRNYETLIKNLKREIRAFKLTRGEGRDPSDYNVNIERIISPRV